MDRQKKEREAYSSEVISPWLLKNSIYWSAPKIFSIKTKYWTNQDGSNMNTFDQQL